MTSIEKTTFLIIGGGISGLACAKKLSDTDFIILEKNDSIGGYCRTFLQKGYVWDYAGHFFHFCRPEIIKELEGLISGSDIVWNLKNTKIRYKNNYIDYPFQYHIDQLNHDEFIDCLVDLVDRPAEEDCSNFEQMLYSKFGKGISEKFLIPYNSKLYACNLNNLDANAMGRFFPMAEPLEIIKGFKRETKKTYNDEFYYSNQGAMALVNQLAKDIDKDKIRCNEPVVSIDLEKKCVTTPKSVIKFDYLINTIPFPTFAKMVGETISNNFTCNQVLVFNIGFDSAPADTKIHWIYYPENQYCFYRVGFYNNILHQEKMSLYVELGFPESEIIDIEYWQQKAVDDLYKAGVITKQKICAIQSLVMNPAYVHIRKNAIDEKEKIKSKLRNKHVETIGRYGDWTYCSIEDCIEQAFSVAKKLRREYFENTDN